MLGGGVGGVVVVVVGGSLFLLFTMETRHVLPHFQKASSESSICQVCVWDTVVSERVPSPPNEPAAKNPFHLDRLSVVEAPENMARGKNGGNCQGMYTVLIAFICDIFEAMDG